MSAKAVASGGLEPGSPGVGREGAGTGRRESIRQSRPARCRLFTAPRGMLEGTLPGIGQGRAVPKAAQRGFKELQLDPRLGPSPKRTTARRRAGLLLPWHSLAVPCSICPPRAAREEQGAGAKGDKASSLLG